MKSLKGNVAVNIENIHCPVIITDQAGYIQTINQSAINLLAYSNNDLFGQPIEVLLPEYCRANHVILRNKYLVCPSKKKMGAGLQIYAKNKLGTLIPVEIFLEPVVIDSNGYIVCYLYDVSQLYHTEQMLTNLNSQLEIKVLERTNQLKKVKDEKKLSEILFSENRALYESIIDAGTDGWWDWKIGTDEIYLSPKLKSVFGYQVEDIDQSVESLKSIMHPDDIDTVLNEIDKHIKTHQPFAQEVRYRCKNGSIKWVICRGKAILDDDGQYRRMIGTHTDITIQKNVEKRLEELAYIDHVTGIPNRFYFQKEIEKIINSSSRYKQKFTLLYLDLDNFKHINDEYGHQIGDSFLKKVASILNEQIRTMDFLARLGGDEFAIILPHLFQYNDINDLLVRILQAYRQPICIEQYKLNTSVSIGVAIYPEHGSSINELLKNSDTAMYQAKQRGKNTYSFYTKIIHERYLRKIEIEKALKQALQQDQFYMEYQPIIDINLNKVYAFEALIRINTDKFDNLSPEEFIPIAEESGLIIQIGEWVLDQVCLQISQWVRNDIFSDIKVCFNCSAIQISQPKFAQVIFKYIEKHHISSKHLIMEITETSLLDKLQPTKKTLLEINKFGIEVAIDDFGIGYSSLNYLKRLPIHILKIDKSFIDDMLIDSESTAIVVAMITMAKALGLKILAEGVETSAQFEQFKSLQGDFIQGHYLSKPLSCKLVQSYLEKYQGEGHK